MNDSKPSAGDSSGIVWQVFLLGSASAFGPLMILANANESPRLITFFLLVAFMTAFGVVWRAILVRLGLDGLGATFAVATLILTAMNAVAWAGSSEVNHLLLLMAALVAGLLAYRMRRSAWFRGLATWAALFLVAYPIAIIGGKALAVEPLNVATGTESEIGPMISKPDIVMVVVDAYGGSETLRELYGFDNSAFQQGLRAKGFEVPEGILANYGRTQLSIPTVLQLEYVADTTVVTDDDIQSLLGVLGGRSRLTAFLQDQGYRTVHVESGWLGSRCGPEVDVCVGSPWPDETFYDAAYRSILEGMPGFELGRPFTLGALSASDWLVNNVAPLLDDDRPDFVFAHILLPHPPLFLDRQCEPDWRGGAGGFAMGRMGFDAEQTAKMRDLYLEQLQCANSLISAFVDQVGHEDVALIMGDHGPDSQGQLFMQSDVWNDSQREERFETFLAARVPGCDMSEIDSLVNVGRRMVSCLTGTPLPDLTTRIFDIHKTVEENRVIEMDIPRDFVAAANQ